jgi:hypothetical protein
VDRSGAGLVTANRYEFDARSLDALDSALDAAIARAERSFRDLGLVPSVLRIEGAGGVATIQQQNRDKDGEKLALLAAALQADLFVSTFETRLLLKGGTTVRVVVVTAWSGGERRMALASFARSRGGVYLRRLATQLSENGGTDVKATDGFDLVGERVRIPPEEAWRQLEVLGVTADHLERTLH